MDLEAEESNNSPIDFYYDNDEYYSYADYDYGDDGLYQACITQLTSEKPQYRTQSTAFLVHMLDYLLHAHCHVRKGSAENTPNKMIRFF